MNILRSSEFYQYMLRQSGVEENNGWIKGKTLTNAIYWSYSWIKRLKKERKKKYNDKKKVKLLWIQRRILGFVLTFYWRQNLFQFEHLKQQLGTRQNWIKRRHSRSYSLLYHPSPPSLQGFRFSFPPFHSKLDLHYRGVNCSLICNRSEAYHKR